MRARSQQLQHAFYAQLASAVLYAQLLQLF
jgi:hypothetical protein